MTETPLDQAASAMNAQPEDEILRLRFFDRLAETDLVLLLEAEPRGDVIEPMLFNPGSGAVALAFDLELRLAEFAGADRAYAAMSGRRLADLLSGAELGLALNLGTRAELLLSAEEIRWLAEILAQALAVSEHQIRSIRVPEGVPEKIILALEEKLLTFTGLASQAYLVSAEYENDGRGHLLAFVDVVADAEAALAAAVREALTFSGLEQGSIDVTFVASSDGVLARLVKVGLQIDLPQAEVPRALDRDAPPRLR